MCLIIGPTGVGKTLLLKRLQNFHSVKEIDKLGEIPSTIPTVGTNLVNVPTGKKQETVIREVGGCMCPIWNSYLKDLTALIFVIDISNTLQIAASCIQFLTVLNNTAVQNTPILLLLNKSDQPLALSRFEVESLMRIDDIRQNTKHQITILEISAFNGKGLTEVIDWVHQASTKS